MVEKGVSASAERAFVIKISQLREDEMLGIFQLRIAVAFYMYG